MWEYIITNWNKPFQILNNSVDFDQKELILEKSFPAEKNKTTHDILFGEDTSDETWTEWGTKHEMFFKIVGCSTIIVLIGYSIYYFNPYYVPYLHFTDISLENLNIDELFSLIKYNLPKNDYQDIWAFLYELDKIEGYNKLSINFFEGLLKKYSESEIKPHNFTNVKKILEAIIKEINKNYE